MDTELRRLSDGELAERILVYLDRVEFLLKMICGYIDGIGPRPSAQSIHGEYAQLKRDIRDDAKYVEQVRNEKGSRIYMAFFKPSIFEAAAEGFCVPSNGRIDQRFYSAVSTARYKLTKYMNENEWSKLAE